MVPRLSAADWAPLSTAMVDGTERTRAMARRDCGHADSSHVVHSRTAAVAARTFSQQNGSDDRDLSVWAYFDFTSGVAMVSQRLLDGTMGFNLTYYTGKGRI